MCTVCFDCFFYSGPGGFRFYAGEIGLLWSLLFHPIILAYSLVLSFGGDLLPDLLWAPFLLALPFAVELFFYCMGWVTLEEHKAKKEKGQVDREKEKHDDEIEVGCEEKEEVGGDDDKHDDNFTEDEDDNGEAEEDYHYDYKDDDDDDDDNKEEEEENDNHVVVEDGVDGHESAVLQVEQVTSEDYDSEDDWYRPVR